MDCAICAHGVRVGVAESRRRRVGGAVARTGRGRHQAEAEATASRSISSGGSSKRNGFEPKQARVTVSGTVRETGRQARARRIGTRHLTRHFSGQERAGAVRNSSRARGNQRARPRSKSSERSTKALAASRRSRSRALRRNSTSRAGRGAQNQAPNRPQRTNLPEQRLIPAWAHLSSLAGLRTSPSGPC